MTKIAEIRDLAKEARPAILQWLEAADLIAGFRDFAKAKDIEWSQLKAVLVAQVKDGMDGGDRLEKLTSKADLALTYADALLPKLNNNIGENPQRASPVSVSRETPKPPPTESGDPARAYSLPAAPSPDTATQTEADSPSATGAGSPLSEPELAASSSIGNGATEPASENGAGSFSSDDDDPYSKLPAFLDRTAELLRGVPPVK